MVGPQQQPHACRCCGGEIAGTLQVPSWRTPDWQEFPYGECGRCGSLTLLDDVDPAPFNARFRRPRSAEPEGVDAGRDRRARLAEWTILRGNPLLRPLARVVRGPKWMLWLAGSGLDRSADVLDVAAGNEGSLLELYRWGFTHLAGIDPTLPADTDLAPNVRVTAQRLDEISDRTCDLIVFHDSLEHLDDPLHLLTLARGLLRSPRGRVAITTSVADGPVWQQYRENWRSLDAPVHRVVPSLAGLSTLARRAGLEMLRSRRDCPGYDLVGSERIRQRIPMPTDGANAMSKDEVAALEQRAKQIATQGNGPQVTAVFRPIR